MSQMLRVPWYRFRVTFGRSKGGYMAVVLLVGLLGGLAMGAVAGARRTQSSYPTLLAITNSSELAALTGVYNPGLGLNNGYDPSWIRTISQLRYVKDVKSQAQVNLLPLRPDGAPVLASEGVSMNGSVDGDFFDQDRVIVLRGRLANPKRADEFDMDAATARAFGFHLGEVVTFVAYTNAQLAAAGGRITVKVPPFLRIKAKLVGVGTVQATNLMQDDVDNAGSSSLVLFTPALTDRLLNNAVNTTVSVLQLDGGASREAAVEAELARVLPKGLPLTFVQLSNAVAKAERTVKPESLALGVFGVIAALALMVIAAQAIGRRFRLNADDLGVLRALGAEPATTVLDGLIGVLGAVLAGSLLAVVVAVGLSPLAPIGPVRPYVPHGIDADWTVLGAGFAILVVALGALAVAIAVRSAPHRASGLEQARYRGSAVARVTGSAGLPVPVVTGVRFAFEPGTGRNKVPVRSAILGAVLAVVVVMSTVIFGASLRTLVTHPALYGWTWSYEMNGGGGLGAFPAGPVKKLLDNDRYVAAWAGVYFGSLQIDGQNVAVMGVSPHAAVGPPILTGHGFYAPNEVVLGAATLAGLHKKVGDAVQVGAPGTATIQLRIVGTATLPTIGIGGTNHLEMGSGALVSYGLIPEGQRNLYDLPPGPNAILVRDKPGTSNKAAVQSLNAIIAKLGDQSNGAAVVGVQKPAEIINYGSLGTTPTLLGTALAAGATVALGLILVASVRRRRRDLALLKTLGFTRTQLASAIAWQSTVAVAIGTAVGIPLGIIVGRSVWDLFAREINAVPAPAVPVPSVVLIALIALVLANLVASVPGRVAARTKTALLLRTE